jgi:hypothetical protein
MQTVWTPCRPSRPPKSRVLSWSKARLTDRIITHSRAYRRLRVHSSNPYATCNAFSVRSACLSLMGSGVSDVTWDQSQAKAVPLHATKALGGKRRYSSYSFSTSALDRGEWSVSCPGRALAPGGERPVHTVQEAEWAPEPVWTQRLEEKSFRLCRGSNLDRPVVQPVARHYTGWATQLNQSQDCTDIMHDYSLAVWVGNI